MVKYRGSEDVGSNLTISAMVLKGLLKNYYDFCEAFVKKHKKGFEDKTKRVKLELNFLKKIEEQSLIQNSDRDRKIHLESELKRHTARLDAALVAEKNLRKKNIIADFQTLNHHAFIKKVEVKDDCLDIYTTELEVDGHDIGNYLIQIPIKEPFGNTLLQIRITNLKKRVIFNDHSQPYDHWFVENGRPCFDQWAPNLSNSLLRGNLLLAVSNLIHFLLSVGGHGYVEVDRWLQQFNEGQIVEEASPDPIIDGREMEEREAQPIPPEYRGATTAIDTGEGIL